MKIKETIERECCHPSLDLRQYRGLNPPATFNKEQAQQLKFCVHCGQLWQNIRQPGELEAGWERVV